MRDLYRVIRKSLRDFRPLRYSSRDGHAEGEHVNRGTDTPSFCPTLRSVHPDYLLRLQKAVSRRTLFCFGMAPGTAHEDLRTVHRCRRHKFAIHHCCATFNIFIQLTVTCSFYSKHRMHCCVSTATMVTRTRSNVTLHVLYIALFFF